MEGIKNVTNDEVSKSYFIENLKNKLYNKQEYVTDNSQLLTNFIRDNDGLIKSDENVLSFVFRKIITHSKMIKEVYTYEMLNYNPDTKINNIDILINIILKEMNRYQGLIGGFYLEDTQWIKCDNMTRFTPRKNQRAIYNSISKYGCRDRDFLTFLKNFISHMEKFVNNDGSIVTKSKIVEDDSNELCWILIVCEQKIDKKIEEPIGEPIGETLD